MKDVSRLSENPKAMARHWMNTSEAMFEGMVNVLSGKEFGPDMRVIDDAVDLFELALNGHPFFIREDSEVYLMLKDVMLSTFGINRNDKIILLFVRWKNILRLAKKFGFVPFFTERKEDLEKMKSFFNALAHRGERERANLHSARQREADEDE
jgi:hypothetical protein